MVLHTQLITHSRRCQRRRGGALPERAQEHMPEFTRRKTCSACGHTYSPLHPHCDCMTGVPIHRDASEGWR